MELKKQGRSVIDFPIAVKIPLVFPDGASTRSKKGSQEVIDSLRRYQDAGATEFCFDILTETCGVALDTMRRFVDEVRPHIMP